MFSLPENYKESEGQGERGGRGSGCQDIPQQVCLAMCFTSKMRSSQSCRTGRAWGHCV